ncbi:MAG: signal peptidase I [Deltaproteobacteria bacterium]|nr:signal peptidase I [Deltaproteobacteria bacterium]
MNGKKKKSKFLETVESIGVALLIALAIRSFVVEPFKIPSSSMVPTLLVGDQIFVNKFIYGLRIPFTKTRVWDGRDPRRGEVFVFIYPKDEGLDFIKRVVGLPGDRIRVDKDKLYVNGEPVPETPLLLKNIPGNKNQVAVEPPVPYKKMTLFPDWREYKIIQEKLGDIFHWAQYDTAWFPDTEFEVPPGYYFAMGDNRDHSSDSRDWGFVPRQNIKGQAMFIWLSFDWDKPWLDIIRWHRFGRWIY